MFIDRLNPQQRQVLFDLAVMLAGADGDISPEEVKYLEYFSKKYSIPLDLEKSHLKPEELTSKLDSQEARIIVLQELIRISYKDGHFGVQEQDKVFQIAQLMGLNDPELILRIEKWVRQRFDWIYEGEQMLK